MGFYYTSVPIDIVKDNKFIGDDVLQIVPLDHFRAKEKLPEPVWHNNATVIDAYWYAWGKILNNIEHPGDNNQFISSYLDSAFNECFLLWNSAFTAHYTYYGQPVFPFENTLNNFYCKQHSDGFICRQLRRSDGKEAFEKHDPSSTGPNILAWAEYRIFLQTGGLERLKKVFPVIVGYHRWLRKFRTWKDGSYWANGWSSGMNNQPRQTAHPDSGDAHFDHGFLSWSEITVQQYISACTLIDIAHQTEQDADIADLHEEKQRLSHIIMSHMFCNSSFFLYDLDQDYQRTALRSIGAFWLLQTDLLNEAQTEGLISHLRPGGTFDTFHPVTSLAKNDGAFSATGNYWCGGVWSPTNYMVFDGLFTQGRRELCHSLAKRHVDIVIETFRDTKTLWENYQPCDRGPGLPSKPEFIGWTGLSVINILFEHVFGIQVNRTRKEILWHISISEEHGIKRLPLGGDLQATLICKARHREEDIPNIYFETNSDFKLVILNFEQVSFIS